MSSPLVVFVPGFQLDSSYYSELAGHVASQGFVVVRADPEDPFTGISHLEMALDVTSVIDWATDPAGPLAGRVDGTAVGTAGHSLGGKVAAMTAFRDDRVNALFAIDPVNGGNPFEGYNPDLPDIVPEEVAALKIPMGFAGETTNGQDADGLPACAPADQNFETFYEAATSAPWRAQWDFIGADHMDFVDDAAECGILCALCPAGSADPEQVSAATRTLAAAFFRRHLGGEAAMERWLTGDKVPAAVTVTHTP